MPLLTSYNGRVGGALNYFAFGTLQVRIKNSFWFRTEGRSDWRLSLGNAYLYGSLVLKDQQKAIFWWQQAAEKGNSNAQLMLAVTLLKQPDDGKHNIQQGMIWLEKAAKQNNLEAKSLRGTMYVTGAYGSPKDLKTAQALLIEATRQGSPSAAMMIGTLSMAGMMFQSDYQQQYIWINLSAQTAIELGQTPLQNSTETISALEKKMTHTQIEQANNQIQTLLEKQREYRKNPDHSFAY